MCNIRDRQSLVNKNISSVVIIRSMFIEKYRSLREEVNVMLDIN